MESNFDKLKSKLREESPIDSLYSWESMQQGIIDKIEQKNDLKKISSERKFYKLCSLILLALLGGLVLYFLKDKQENVLKQISNKNKEEIFANSGSNSKNNVLPQSSQHENDLVITEKNSDNAKENKFNDTKINPIATSSESRNFNATEGTSGHDVKNKTKKFEKAQVLSYGNATTKQIYSQKLNNSKIENSSNTQWTNENTLNSTSGSSITNYQSTVKIKNANEQNTSITETKSQVTQNNNQSSHPSEIRNTETTKASFTQDESEITNVLASLPIVYSQLVYENQVQILSPLVPIQKTIRHNISPISSIIEIGCGSNFHSKIMDQNTTAVLGYSASILGRFSKNNIYASTGLDYIDHVERIDFEKQVPVILYNQHVTTQVNQITGESKDIYADSIEVFATRTVRHFNNYHNLSIPLSFGYQKQFGKILIGSGLGARFSKLISQSGRNIANNEVVDFNTSNANIDGGWKINVFGEMMLSYAITDKWFVGTRLNSSITSQKVSLLSDGQTKKVSNYNAMLTLGMKF